MFKHIHTYFFLQNSITVIVLTILYLIFFLFHITVLNAVLFVFHHKSLIIYFSKITMQRYASDCKYYFPAQSLIFISKISARKMPSCRPAPLADISPRDQHIPQRLQHSSHNQNLNYQLLTPLFCDVFNMYISFYPTKEQGSY